MVSSEVPRVEQDGDIVFDATIRAEVLKDLVSILRSVADECVIHIERDGIHVNVDDPAHVAMVGVDLNNDVFESYDSGQVVIALVLSRLDDRIGMADDDDEVRLRVDMETRKLKIEIGENIKPTMGLIDPDTVRAEPDNPEMDLPNHVTIPTEGLEDAVTAIDMVTDHIKIGWDSEAEHFVVFGEGDIDSTRVEFGPDMMLDGDFEEEAAALYSIGYFKNFKKAIPDSASPLTLAWGDDFPVVWEYDAHDSSLEFEGMIAPRIQSD